MPIIEKGLLLGWSPEKISLRMKIEVPEIAISHTTVYKRISANKTCGGSLYKKLPRFGKKRCKGGKRKAGRALIPNRTDISERPEIVDLRSRIGDWEGDTVYGQDAHLYPSPFKLHRCWLRSLTPITYYFVGSRGFAHLPPRCNLKSFGYITRITDD